MAYFVIKTIAGRRYLYWQSTWRQGSRVRSQSRSLGPLDPSTRRSRLGQSAADLEAHRQRVLDSSEKYTRQVEREQRERFGETAGERAARERTEALDELHRLYGLRVDPPEVTEAQKDTDEKTATGPSAPMPDR